MAVDVTEPESPSRLGNLLGTLLLLLGGACGVQAFNWLLTPVPPEELQDLTSSVYGELFGFIGLGLLFLYILPTVLFARAPRWVGGLLGLQRRRMVRFCAPHGRLALLIDLWFGLYLLLSLELLALFPTLRLPTNPVRDPLFTALGIVGFLPPLALFGWLMWELLRRRWLHP